MAEATQPPKIRPSRLIDIVMDIPFFDMLSGQDLKEVAKHMNIEIKTGLDTESIHRLIREAQINVLPTFQATGIKLKLLAALYMGRHCLVNSYMVENTGLESLCRVEDTPKRMISAVQSMFTDEFNGSHTKKREDILNGRFCNAVNAQKLYSLIYKD